MSGFIFVRNVWFRFCTKCLVSLLYEMSGFGFRTRCRVYEFSCVQIVVPPHSSFSLQLHLQVYSLAQNPRETEWSFEVLFDFQKNFQQSGLICLAHFSFPLLNRFLTFYYHFQNILMIHWWKVKCTIGFLIN